MKNFTNSTYSLAFYALLSLALVACEGGSSTSTLPDTSTDPYGLTERAPLPSFNLPQQGVAIGSYSAEKVYPRIRGNLAVDAASVPGESRIVFAEKDGILKVFDDSLSVTQSTVLLDIAYRVQSVDGEQGLLGLAFDPDFTNNRYIYLNYTRDNPLSSVISRFFWDTASDSIDETSEEIILLIDQPFSGHNGGGLAFGPDGYLYIGSGDGGDGGDPLENAQNLSTLLGKVLRIDVHPDNPNLAYAIPSDNPFIDTADARPEIYAYGFRNPVRFSFDQQTGDLWLGDVGQENYEEVNLVVAGGNYGWRYFEGNNTHNYLPQSISPDSFTYPVHTYDHTDGNVAVIGGRVYRGTAIPSLVGKYIYGDYLGQVWALTLEDGEVVGNDPITKLPKLTAFMETSDGELLVVSYTDGFYKLSNDAATGDTIPTRLSETGLFSDLASLTPAQGMIPYQPNHPFWSDGVLKQRWVGVPDDGTVEFTDEDWTFPLGSVAVKHFSYYQSEDNPGSEQRIETRVMLNSDQGWQGFTYRWNEEQTDATLVSGRRSITLSVTQADSTVKTQQYDIPSQGDCLRCHTEAEGWILGLNTAQLNGDFDYGQAIDNQIRSWNNIGLFNSNVGSAAQYPVFPSLTDMQADLSSRARAYLDVNCSVCHQPGGGVNVNLDLRAVTPDAEMNAIDAEPTAGNLGIEDARIIAPGEKERSILWQRISRLDDKRMPPLSSHVLDQQAIELIGQWIDGL